MLKTEAGRQSIKALGQPNDSNRKEKLQ